MNDSELIRRLYWESFHYDGDSLYRLAAKRLEELLDERNGKHGG